MFGEMRAHKTVKLQPLPLPSSPMIYKKQAADNISANLTWLLCQSGVGLRDEHGWGVFRFTFVFYQLWRPVSSTPFSPFPFPFFLIH